MRCLRFDRHFLNSYNQAQRPKGCCSGRNVYPIGRTHDRRDRREGEGGGRVMTDYLLRVVAAVVGLVGSICLAYPFKASMEANFLTRPFRWGQAQPSGSTADYSVSESSASRAPCSWE